uniref:DUF72 domain-containing protein n=1 Tax=Thaumasiovibrio occultus TaxID=1891184 RepID=UPI000B3508C9|nr:DUF72 domain-containing protein [Thaumasiovibrio occultus]
MSLYLGLAQWSSPAWQQSVYGSGTPTAARLEKYAEHFNTVEGSTTFYATPTVRVAQQWADAVPETFKFTFKLPQQITHQLQLRHAHAALNQFFTNMTPLLNQTGIWNIQLPAKFGPAQLPDLARFVRALPDNLPLGVEVRHPAFFAKGEEERQLNALLIEHKINRVIMDSRPVFSHQRNDEALLDAQQKKPNVPVHAIATADNPMIRFIGIDRDNTVDDWQANLPFFSAWEKKLPQWIGDDKTPYMMVHTPDNALGPILAHHLYARLQGTGLLLPNLPSLKQKPDDAQLNLI